MSSQLLASACDVLSGPANGLLGRIGDDDGASNLPSPTAIGNLSTWYDVSDKSSLTLDGSDNCQLIADKSGNSSENCLVLPGAASNTAAAATKTITGNQTFTVDLELASYTPAATQTLFTKLLGNNGIELQILLTTGVVRLRVGDGASVTNVDSTVGIGLTDLARGTLVVAWEDGVGASFTVDGVALGTPVAAAKTLTNGAADANIGPLTGNIYRVQVGGVYDFNPATAAKLATSVPDGIGGTWVINTTAIALPARIHGARDLYMGTAASQPLYTTRNGRVGLLFDGVADYMKTAPFALSQPENIYFVGEQVTWTANDKFYDGSGVANRMFLGQRNTGSTPEIETNAGSSGPQVSPALGVGAVLFALFDTTSSLLRINRNTSATGDAGTQAGNGLTLGALYTGSTAFANTFVSEILIYDTTAQDTATQDRVALYEGQKWGILV